MRVSRLSLIVLALLGGLVLYVLTPGPALAQSLHALPVSYNPTPNAVLKAPPSRVVIRFSEHLDSDLSKIVVVNPSNQEVDNHDSHVESDGYTMTVSLPLLQAGTYVVFWRTHSADDGHITSGSYIFHIARADGTVPPLSGALPSGFNFGVGGAGNANSALDVNTFLEALARWITVVALTLVLGMIFWWRFVLPRQTQLPAGLRIETVTRFRQAAELAFETIIGATIVEIAEQAIIVNGSIQGVTSLPLLGSILFQSRYGWFLVARIGVSVLGILCLNVSFLRTILRPGELRWVLPMFGVVLAVIFEYGGHGGAATVWWGPAIDLLHLLANGIWLGGLFALALCIIPALRARSADERNAYLSAGIPAFSVPALVAAATLAITGPLNADARLTSLSQLWTTGYGAVLLVKISLFLVMMAISYYHAFRQRPQLTAALGVTGQGAVAAPAPVGQTALVRWMEQSLHAFERWQAPSGATAIALPKATTGLRPPQSDQIAALAGGILRWLRIEAGVGALLLLCAMLLGPLAATLAPTLAQSTSLGAAGGSQRYTQQADQLTVTLNVSPGKFGTNTFTVVVKNPDGSFASGGSVEIVTDMVEMDMGTNSYDLQPASAAGTYTGPVELPMAGHWKCTVIVRTLQDPKNLHRTTFTVSASY